jgi:RNA polymerase sigma-70 factor (ECF subfamily)
VTAASDEALMRAVRDGDIPKLGVLFERHHVPLFQFLSRATGDRAAAEDLVQEVFVRILKYRRTYRDEGRFETWMFHIARNVRSDHARRRRPEQPLEPFEREGLEPAAGGPAPDSQLAAKQDVEEVRRALMKLPDDKRELLVLSRYHGMKHEQLAAVLRVDVGTVRVRVHRALKELKEMVERLAGEDRTWNAKKRGTDLRMT